MRRLERAVFVKGQPVLLTDPMWADFEQMVPSETFPHRSINTCWWWCKACKYFKRVNDTPARALDRADPAVYAAKAGGRNRIIDHADLVRKGHVSGNAKVGDIELF